MKPKSPAEMLEAIARNLPQRTGKTLEAWARLVRSKGPSTTKDRVAWLRAEHGLGSPTAAVIVASAEGRDPTATYQDSGKLIRAMYSGPKAGLRPIHEAVMKAVRALGKDVQTSARKTYVTLSRKRQFAVIQPSTSRRVDLGLVLSGVKPVGRLEATKSVGGGRITHRIALTQPSDIDKEAKKWLQAAYDQDAR